MTTYILRTAPLKIVLFFAIILMVFVPLRAQTRADNKLAEILTTGDLFFLKEQYPRLSDSVSVSMLHLLSHAQLGIGFNRLEDASSALDSLLRYYQFELGPDNSLGLAALFAMNQLNMGRYAEGGSTGEKLVRQLRGKLSPAELSPYVFFERVGTALASVPPPSHSRPAHDVRVPMKVEAAGGGVHFQIPVEVNGITKNFIFDTGCSFGNFVTEAYAKEVGLKILTDSVPVSGVSIGLVKLATADSLRVGDITHYHPVFMVAPPDPQLDSVFTFNGVLGYHFIRDVKEVVIDNESRTFLFPYKISAGPSNMYISSNIPQIRVEIQGKPNVITFDTGNVKSTLAGLFIQQYPELVSGLEKRTTFCGGFGGIKPREVYTLPEFSLRLFDQSVTLRQTDVDLSCGGFGSLGTDFVLAFKRLTINYESMYVRGEGADNLLPPAEN